MNLFPSITKFPGLGLWIIIIVEGVDILVRNNIDKTNWIIIGLSILGLTMSLQHFSERKHVRLVYHIIVVIIGILLLMRWVGGFRIP